ncbi:hypothetical protein KJ877_01835 [bacterium]|nr:hypothetical protein [bacterium]MBU1991300.1 hypothetical protein [bacterium]
MQRKQIVLNLLASFTVLFGMSGCSSLQETFASQMEVPTLEHQANRVAIGMTIVRENNIMLSKIPISADALWPKAVSAEINDTDKKFIEEALMDDAYYSTSHYTNLLQRNMLGSSASMNQLGDFANIASIVLDQSVSPLTYRAMQKIVVLYGKNEADWPNVFNFDGSLSDFLNFKEGKLIDIEAASADVYQSLGEGVIALTPVNLQKDLSRANLEMLEGFAEVLSLQAQKGEIESKLKSDTADALSEEEKLELEEELRVVEATIAEAESIADEKEAIYFQLLDQAVVSLESDINIDDENYVKLAKNINIVSSEVQAGATEAYASFGLALANIGSSNIILNFPTELKSLAIGKAMVPMNLQSKYDERIARLVKNALYLLPNIFMGTYYANKQSTLAQKYEEVTAIIILAYDTKMEQESLSLK